MKMRLVLLMFVAGFIGIGCCSHVSSDREETVERVASDGGIGQEVAPREQIQDSAPPRIQLKKPTPIKSSPEWIALTNNNLIESSGSKIVWRNFDGKVVREKDFSAPIKPNFKISHTGMLAVGQGKKLILYDKTNKEVKTIPLLADEPAPLDIAISPNAKWIAVSYQDDLLVIHAENPKLTHKTSPFFNQTHGEDSKVVFDAEGKQLVQMVRRGDVTYFARYKMIVTADSLSLDDTSSRFGLRFKAIGFDYTQRPFVLFEDQQDSSITVFENDPPRRITTALRLRGTVVMAWDPLKTQKFAITTKDHLVMKDINSTEKTRIALPDNETVKQIVWSPDGRHIALRTEKSILIYNVRE